MPDLYYWQPLTTSQDPTVGNNWTRASDSTTGNVPTTGDSVVISAIAGVVPNSIEAADQHAILLANLTISQTFTNQIGGATAKWQIRAGNVTIPAYNGPPGTTLGSGSINLDIGNAAGTVTIAGTAPQATYLGLEQFRIIGSAITAINVIGGTVGIATSLPGDTATVTTINVSGQAVVNAASGVTWTTASAASSFGGGGAALLTLNSAGTTLTTSAGATAIVNGTGLVGTSNVGGTSQHNNRVGGVDVTTLNVYSGGFADFSNNQAASTVTTTNLFGGGQIYVDPANPSHVTFTTLNKKNGGLLGLS